MNNNINLDKNKTTIFCDMDGVVLNTIQALCEYYNNNYQHNIGFAIADPNKAYKWNLNNICPLMSNDIEEVFNKTELFTHMKLMDNCKESLLKLKQRYNIILVTIGSLDNIISKCTYIKDNDLKQCFDGLIFYDNIKCIMNKSIFNMTDCIFLDDNASNLESVKYYPNIIPICFGKTYEFNENWKGCRLLNWNKVCETLL